MHLKSIPRGAVHLALVIAVGTALVVAAAILGESFGWDEALGFTTFLAALVVGFVTARYSHRHQSL
jgi:uncharacterized membrane protein YjjB (DUF3815 family)